MKPKRIGLFIYLVLASLIGYVFVACSSDEPSVESFDQDSPHLVNVSPGDSSADVPVNTAIYLSFDEAMYPSTINFTDEDDDCEGSLQLSADDFDSCVPLSQKSFSYSDDKMSFSVSPQSPLEASQKYRIRITTEVKDLALNPLEKEYDMKAGFMTGSASDSDPEGGGPVENAQYIYFGDENTEEFVISGGLEIVRAEDESDITGYNLYWGSSDSEKLVNSGPINSFLISDEYIEHYFDNVTIPEDATHFLAYAYNDSGESAVPVSQDIRDTVLKLVADINPSGPSNPHSFHVWNGKLYFSADGDTSTEGRELWEFDGVSYPSLVEDINPSAGSSMVIPQEMVEFNNKLYFNACEPTNGCELREYDGVSVKLVSDINSGPSPADGNPSQFLVFNNNLYFSACDNNAPANCELWYWDGSGSYPITPGTNLKLAANIASGTQSSGIEDMTKFNGLIYLTAWDDATSYGDEVWWYDGAPTAAVDTNYKALDIDPGIGDSNPSGITEYNGLLYFQAYSTTHGTEVWWYNGTTSTPIPGTDYDRLTDINPGSGMADPKDFVEYNGSLYFSANNGPDGTEFWQYDGTNTYMVADIEPSGSSNPSGFIEFNGMLLFSAWSSGNGTELYGYDNYGEDNYPFMIADINPGSGNSNPEFFTEFNGRLYFAANGGSEGTELWVFYSE